VTPLLVTLIEPGFWTSAPVRTALLVGAVVAAVSGPVGMFMVIRGQSFAGEALGDIGTMGGSGAFLAGAGPLWGFLAAGMAAATAMEMIGIQRARGRDLATGIVLGAGLGAAALFLYWDATYHNTTGATMTILFGSAFTISPSTTPTVAAFSAVTLIAIVLIQRPLLLSSVSPDLAAARGIPVRFLGGCYLAALAIAVALAAATIGTILSTALLVGPAATATRLTKRPGRAMIAAALIGTAALWLGVLLAYDSYDWPPIRHGWPVSFFVVTLLLVGYLAAHLPGRSRHSPSRPTTNGHARRHQSTPS
jgi:zinc/manganese transport system permease protein